MMRKMMAALGAAAAILGAVLLTNLQASAQVIQLGGSEGDMKAVLSSRGYDRIDVVDRGLSSTTFEACQTNKRVRFKMYWDGRIGNPEVIGGCRNQITRRDIEILLSQAGYERINLENVGGNWIAIGCKGPSRNRAVLNPYGDIREEKRIGDCRPQLTTSDIEAILTRAGYDRIEFKVRQPPRFVANACRDLRRLELVINESGDISGERRIGQCESPMTAYDVAKLLGERGFARVSVIDTKPPRYKFEACRRDDRVELVVDVFGRILDEVRVGRCRAEVSLTALIDMLSREGYTRINAKADGQGGYNVVACMKNRRFDLVLSRYGEVIRERDIGACTAVTVRNLVDGLLGDGYRDGALFFEGCRGNDRYRIDLTPDGEVRAANRIGRC